ncbi:hypothetical protein R3Q06_36315, partial [Rhodococcus erythropolis]|uniref:hypothetical protein n=1 Tax=Rhodococcus erythropolis TaxID=1833 RepID=UPI00294A1E7F
VELYRKTNGATTVGLGVSHRPMTAWLKNAGVPIRGPDTSGEPRPDPAEEPSGSAPRLHTYTRRKPSLTPSETSCDLQLNISSER